MDLSNLSARDASMFRRVTKGPERSLTIFIDGAQTLASPGDSVAAAMLAAGDIACRTTALSGTARGPFCLMGVCFDCLVTIDGIASLQACMIPAREGMRIETRRGKRTFGT
jgi:D-hydroxyproline dehydrogenase subunit gamma